MGFAAWSVAGEYRPTPEREAAWFAQSVRGGASVEQCRLDIQFPDNWYQEFLAEATGDAMERHKLRAVKQFRDRTLEVFNEMVANL